MRKELDTFMGITQRVVDLTLWTNSKPHIKMLDVYIAPEKVNDFSFFSSKFSKEFVLLSDFRKTSIRNFV